MMDTSALKRSYDEMVGEAVESEKEKEIKKEASHDLSASLTFRCQEIAESS